MTEFSPRVSFSIDALAADAGLDASSSFSAAFAYALDAADSLAPMRDRFLFPPAITHHGEGGEASTATKKSAVYLCGNSLGLQPRHLGERLTQQLDKWAAQGVEGHFEQPTPWMSIDDIVVESSARLVGALPSEVVVMNSLTANLHFMMASFYRPTAQRFKIVTEKKAFPSDTHAVVSQLRLHGYNPETALIEVAPREGEHTLRDEDILQVIREHGSSIALVLFTGVQYYTGQFFDLASITAAGREQGAVVGLDLAHAVGNVPLSLHDWGVDFACWCTYKYLNSGPGCVGGCFVHERHGTVTGADGGAPTSGSDAQYRDRMAGWWGHRPSDRFVMAPDFIPCEGAYGFRVSNAPALNIVCVRASLDLFDEAGGMKALRHKSVRLTGYLEHLLKQEMPHRVTILTPSEPWRRGAQLSLSFDVDIDAASAKLASAGVICDVRRPNVIRIAPAPLYNSFSDVYEFVRILKDVLLEREVERITYGSTASQFFDISVPRKPWTKDQTLPIAVIVHGGFWKAKYGIHNSAIDNLAPYLVNERMATVELEYRRVSPDKSLGDDEGGWERTKDDIITALKKLSDLASTGLYKGYRLDLSRVVFIGHSAGGQLVSWLCSAKSDVSLPFKPAVCVPLAPVCDLFEATRRRLSDDGDAVEKFMGCALTKETDAFYRSASPAHLLPLVCPTIVAIGEDDVDIPVDMVRDYCTLAAAESAPVPVELLVLPSTDHYTIVSSKHKPWERILLAMKKHL